MRAREREGVAGAPPVYRAEDGAAAGVFQIITSGCGSGGGFPWQPQYLQSLSLYYEPTAVAAAQPSGAAASISLSSVSLLALSLSPFSVCRLFYALDDFFSTSSAGVTYFQRQLASIAICLLL